MLTINFPPILKVSYSRIRAWRSCHRKHHYRYNENLRRKKKPIFAFIGTAIHACIEYYQEGRDWREYLVGFAQEYDRLFSEEKVMLGDLPKELETIMENYFHFYSEDGLSYPKRRGRRTEIPVKVQLDQNTVFIGFIDAFPRDEEGRNWIMDHKSFKTMPDEDSRFSDYQLVVYYWLLPQVGYEKPDGVIWDYIRNKAPVAPEQLKDGSLSKKKNQDTTTEVYMRVAVELFGEERAEKEYGEFARETFEGREDKFFRRIPLPHPPQKMVDEVVGDLMESIWEIRHFGRTSKVRTMSRDCKLCEYYGICSAELRGLDTDFMRKSDYYMKGNANGREKDPRDGESSDE